MPLFDYQCEDCGKTVELLMSTNADQPTQEAEQAPEQAEVYCTVVSRQPTPGPTEQSLVPLVGDQDWTQGPDDAQVTFIEYGDFQ